MKRWWLSFCDPNRPEGQRFLGVSIVLASNFIAALKVAHALGVNPGGAVQGFEMLDPVKIDRKWMERLLTRAECEALDAELEALGTEAPDDLHVHVAHAGCQASAGAASRGDEPHGL